MEEYILVAQNEESDAVELPLEDDGTLLLTTVEAQFTGASGLKFLNPKSGASRGIRLADGKLHPPEKEGWGERLYLCVFADSKKRRASDDDGPASKSARLSVKCTDLIVRGLPWETSEDTMKEYFESKYGELVLVQIKKGNNGKSKGFGFIRFCDYEHQRKALLATDHEIDGRPCKVDLSPSVKDKVAKIFVGGLTPEIAVSDLNDYFSAIGDVTDCFIPKKGFGYVTFMDPECAKVCCDVGNHTINGVNVNVKIAFPKADGPNRGGGFRDRGNSRNSGNFSDGGRYSDRGNSYGGRSGGRNDGGGNWVQGGRSRRDDSYGGGSNRDDFRGVSPTRLLSLIKDSGILNSLGSGNTRGDNGYHRDGGADDGYNRSYRSDSRYDNKQQDSRSWGNKRNMYRQ